MYKDINEWLSLDASKKKKPEKSGFENIAVPTTAGVYDAAKKRAVDNIFGTGDAKSEDNKSEDKDGKKGLFGLDTKSGLIGAGAVALGAAAVNHVRNKNKYNAMLQAQQAMMAQQRNRGPRYGYGQMSEPNFAGLIGPAIGLTALSAVTSGVMQPVADMVRGYSAKAVDNLVPGMRNYGYNQPQKFDYAGPKFADYQRYIAPYAPDHRDPPKQNRSALDSQKDARDAWLAMNLKDAKVDDLDSYFKNKWIPNNYAAYVSQIHKGMSQARTATGEDLTFEEYIRKYPNGYDILSSGASGSAGPSRGPSSGSTPPVNPFATGSAPQQP